MAGNKYMTAGTLAGVEVIVDIFNTGHMTSQATLIKNDSLLHTYLVNFDGNAGTGIPLLPLEELRMRGDIKWISLNGTGDYRIIAVEDIQELPDLNTGGSGGGGAVYTADEATLHLAGTVFSIKNGGVHDTEIAASAVTGVKINNGAITRPKVDTGIVLDGFMSDQARFDCHLGQPAPASTCRVQLTAISDQVYTFVVGAPGAPGEVQIGGTTNDTMENLRLAIVALQGASVHALRDGNILDLWSDNAVAPSISLSSTSANLLTLTASPGQNRPPYRVANLSVKRLVNGPDATRGVLIQGLPGCLSVIGFNITVLDGLDRIKAFDGTVSAYSDHLHIANAGAVTPLVASDTILINATCIIA